MIEQLKEQLQHQRDRDEKLRMDVEAKLAEQKLELQSQLTRQKEEMEAKIDKMQAKIDKMQMEQQLVALQARLEALHAAKLLTDDELFAIEDTLVDSLESASDGSRLVQLIELSARLPRDATFARQLRRKVLS